MEVELNETKNGSANKDVNLGSPASKCMTLRLMAIIIVFLPPLQTRYHCTFYPNSVRKGGGMYLVKNSLSSFSLFTNIFCSLYRS